MDEGPGASQSRETEPEMPDAVALVDRAVASLGEIDRKVVKAYYLRWAPREVSAAACRMRVRQFDAVLNRARWRISGMLAR